MNIYEYSTKKTNQVAKEFNVNPKKGLDQSSVTQRLRQFGFNRISMRETKAWHIFLRQFRSSFVYLLFGAVIVTILLGETTETLMILFFLVFNSCLGFYQEYRSEKTVKLLSKFTFPRAKVVRNGITLQIASENLVPGDIIILETGDRIPADVRLIEQHNLSIDETILTGESGSVFKTAEALDQQPTAYHQAQNLCFSGTDVLRGKAKAIVITTGHHTVMGEITKLTGEIQKISDFEKGISRFSQFIIKLVGFTIFIVLLANVFLRNDGVRFLDLIIFSIALTVSVIPEALPIVTTFSLSLGIRRLANNKVIVKRLSAIEDLGGIEILCSDKTGTLTENTLQVANIYADNRDQTLFYANVASSVELMKKTEPFDIALEQELTSQQKKKIKNTTVIADEPFDPRMRRNVVFVKTSEKHLLITRGAPEEVFHVCSDNNLQNKKNIFDWITREGEQGHRVLAIAYKEVKKIDKDQDIIKIFGNDNFTFSGVISFVDPIKKSSFKAIKKARELGVRILIMTGDSLEVSGAVGRKIGLINSPDQVMSGERWERMTSEEKTRCLHKYSVLARVSPEQKYKIVKFLQKQYIVGFLGEGINDTPALKKAGVSLVVDSAVDIAREAADIILLKKNLDVVLDGIKEGRQVFANTTKYIKSTLSSNFGNFFAVAAASLMIDFLPMLPVQILLVNLLSDLPMITISTDTVDKDELQSPKKYEIKDILMLAIILGMVSMVFDFIFFGLFYRISPEVLQTNWFIGSILTEIALIFSIRTKSLFLKGARPSRSLLWLSILVVLTTISLPYTSFGKLIFHFTPPTNTHLMLILSLVIIYFACSELVKLFYYKSKIKNISL